MTLLGFLLTVYGHTCHFLPSRHNLSSIKRLFILVSIQIPLFCIDPYSGLISLVLPLSQHFLLFETLLMSCLHLQTSNFNFQFLGYTSLLTVKLHTKLPSLHLAFHFRFNASAAGSAATFLVKRSWLSKQTHHLFLAPLHSWPMFNLHQTMNIYLLHISIFSFAVT